jgi:hypothetical protein
MRMGHSHSCPSWETTVVVASLDLVLFRRSGTRVPIPVQLCGAPFIIKLATGMFSLWIFQKLLKKVDGPLLSSSLECETCTADAVENNGARQHA